jgi:hypothetical protein
MVAFDTDSINNKYMSEQKPFALLLHDDFMGEYVDTDREGETFQSLESAHWGAGVLIDELHGIEKDLGNDNESFPYKVYIVGPDGIRTPSYD